MVQQLVQRRFDLRERDFAIAGQNVRGALVEAKRNRASGRVDRLVARFSGQRRKRTHDFGASRIGVKSAPRKRRRAKAESARRVGCRSKGERRIETTTTKTLHDTTTTRQDKDDRPHDGYRTTRITRVRAQPDRNHNSDRRRREAEAGRRSHRRTRRQRRRRDHNDDDRRDNNGNSNGQERGQRRRQQQQQQQKDQHQRATPSGTGTRTTTLDGTERRDKKRAGETCGVQCRSSFCLKKGLR